MSIGALGSDVSDPERLAGRGPVASWVENLETGRDMSFYASSDEKMSALTKDRVDNVLRKWIDSQQTVIVTAGDFAKVKSEAEKEGDK